MSVLSDQVEALRSDPTSLEAAEALRARAADDLEAFACAFADRGHRLAELGHPDAIDSLLEAAQAYEEDLDELARAATLYEKVLELDPAHRRALFALGPILYDLSRIDDLIDLYRQRYALARDDGERTTLHLYISELLSEQADDDHAAFEEIKKAAQLTPKNLRIISRLERLGERTGQLNEVAVVIGDLMLHADDPRVKAGLSLRLAELHMGPLDDTERALVYFRSALVDDGGNPGILQEIHDVFGEQARFDELAALLEDVSRERRVGPQRGRMERELAALYEHELSNLPRALAAMARAVRSAPDDRELIDEVMRLGLVTSDMQTVADTFEEVVVGTSNPMLRNYARLKLGHLYASTLAQPENAVRVYGELLDEEPGHLGVLRRLASVHKDKLEDLEAAQTVYRRILDLAPDDVDANQALDQISEVVAADDPLAAIESSAIATEHAVGGTEGEVEILDERLLEDEGDEQVVDVTADAVLSSRAILKAVGRPDDALASRLAEESDDDLGAERSQVHVIVRVPPEAPADDDEADEEASDETSNETSDEGDEEEISDDPSQDHNSYQGDDDTADSEDLDEPIPAAPPAPLTMAEVGAATADIVTPTAEALADAFDDGAVTNESAIALHEAEGEAETEYYAEPATDSVLPQPSSLRRQQEAIEDRVVELQQRLQDATRSSDVRLQVELLTEIIGINAENMQHERAFHACVKLVRLEPTLDRINLLIRYGGLALAQDELVDTYDQVAHRLDETGQIHFGLAIADIEASDLDNTDGALARLASLHAMAPENVLPFERWTLLLEDAGRHDELVVVLCDEASRSEDARARTLFDQAAKITEASLGDPSAAADILMQMLQRTPADEAVRADAARLLEAAERWGDLARILEEHLYRRDGRDRAALRRRIAWIYAEQLRDLDAAESMLLVARDEVPDDTDTLEQITALYESRENWSKLVDALTEQVRTVRGPRARSVLRRRISYVAEYELAQPDLALRHLEEAVRDDPADLEAIGDIERLRRDMNDWGSVIEALILKSRALAEPNERAEALVEIARIREESLSDAAGAAEAFRDALAIAPQHEEALEEYAELAERSGDYSVAIDALRDLASELDSERKALVHARVGRILEMRLGQPEDAAFEYQLSLDANPECLEALDALRQYHQAYGDKAKALELCCREADLTKDDRRSAMLWIRAAELALHGTGDRHRAMECFERALDTDPDDLSTEATLGELYHQEGEHERAYTHLSRSARGLKRSDAERAANLYVLAGEAAERLELDDKAKAAYEASLEIDPTAKKPTMRLAELLTEREEAGRAYEVNATLLLRHETDMAPEELAAVYLRMARAKHALEDLDAAIRLARKAAENHDNWAAPLEFLTAALEESGDDLAAAECATRLASKAFDDEGQARALLRAAKLYADKVSDLPTAIPLLVEASELAPRDLEISECLADLRARIGRHEEAAEGLASMARRLSGRPRADALVRAARVASAGRMRIEAKQLLSEAMEIASTHRDGLAELRVMLEFDGDHAELAQLEERAASTFLQDPLAAADAPDGDTDRAALTCYESALALYRYRLDLPVAALRIVRAKQALATGGLDARQELARAIDAAISTTPESERGTLRQESEEAWSEVVDAQPGLLHGLRRLSTLRSTLGQGRMARLPAEVLAVLGEATVDERQRVGLVDGDETGDEGLPFAPPAGRRLKVPLHDDERSDALALLGSLGLAPLEAFNDALPEPRLKKRDRSSLQALGAHVSGAIVEAANIIGAELPPIYARDDAPATIVPAYAEGVPVLLVSQALAASQSAALLRFHAARVLTLLRPRALGLALLPLDVYRDGLEGLAREALPEAQRFGDPKRTKKRGRALERALPPTTRADITAAVADWLARPGRTTLLSAQDAVNRSAERAGLVASGSLLVAVNALGTSGHLDRDWFIPLVEFATTRQFAAMITGDE